MFANKNKEKNSRARTVATGADSTKLSSTDSRYDAGDYEAVPATIRKIRDERNKAREEQNAIPAEEIIARQEAEIAELKRQAEAANMTNKYKSVLDDEEEHPTFKNPDSMADFGDYEAVASTARFEAAGRDPNQKVFRAKPSVAARKVAKPSELTPGDYEAVAASARKAVPPDEFVPDVPQDDSSNISSDAVASQNEETGYMTDAEAARASRQAPSRDVPEFTAPKEEPSDDVIHSEPYTPPQPAPAPVSAADYTVEPAPAPAPAPVSAADYTVQSYSAPEPAPAPAPVSAADYTVQSYSAPEPAPAPAPISAADYTVQSYSAPASSSNDNAIHREPYTPPSAKSSSSSYSAQSYVPPAQRNKYSDDGNYDVGGGPMYSPTSGKRIASFEDMAPGDYEAVADSTYDDSDMDLADGSYDFDKFLAGAPSLQMQAPAPSPEESDWADLGPAPEDIDDVDITDEQTRALTEAIAQETLSNQPGTQFEDIIDNVIAKVLERKKAEDAAKAAAQQEQQKSAEPQPQPQQPEQNPAAPQQPEQNPAAPQQPQQPEQNPAAPQQPEQPQQNPAAPQQLQQPEQNPAAPQQPQNPAEVQANKGLTPGAIDPSTPIEDIPALIVAELDSASDVSDDDIRKSIDAALIGKLTTGELTLDSVQSVRNKILDEIHEMQEEEARILAQLEGKPEKHPFDPDFLSADIPVEEIPDAVIAELDNIDGEVSDDDVKKSIDKVMIAKLAKGDLTLDSFEEARNNIFDTLGIETAEEEAAEESEPAKEPVPEPVEEPEPAPVEEQKPAEEVQEKPEPEEESATEPVEEPEPAPVEEQKPVEELETFEEPVPVEEPAEETARIEEQTEETHEEPEPVEETESTEEELVSESEVEESEEELVSGPDLELTEEVEEENIEELPAEDSEEPVEEEPKVESTEEESIEKPTEDEPVDESTEEEPVSESEVEEESEEETSEEDALSESEDEHAQQTEEVSDEEEEEEEQSTPIPVPKEPTVLEYDPYADVFVNPADEPEESVSEDSEEEPADEEPPEEEVTVESADEEPSEETSEEEPAEESEELLETPLSAAAVLAMQDSIEDHNESESSDSDNEVEDSLETEVQVATEPEPDAEAETEPDNNAAKEHDDVLDMQITFDDIFRNPFVNDFEPLEPAEETAPVENESEPTVEAEPFENESEPTVEAEPEVEEIPDSEENNEDSSEEGVEDLPETEETVEDVSEAEEVIEETPESDGTVEDVSEVEEKTEDTPEAEVVIEETPTEEAKTEEAPEEEENNAEASDEEDIAEEVFDQEENIREAPVAEETVDETPIVEETVEETPVTEETVDEAPVTEDNDEEPKPEPELESEDEKDFDEYAEAKEKRHDDMQSALLMAMIDDKEKTFSDAVNYMIDQDELNAKTLRTRMPIDRDTLDRVIKERDFIPDKKTAIAICFALRLTWEDSIRLLYKAGYSLNDTERYDLTIEYLMRRGVYDQNMINSVLMGSGLEGFGIPQSEI